MIILVNYIMSVVYKYEYYYSAFYYCLHFVNFVILNVALLYIFAVSQCDLTHRVREGHLFFFLSVRYRNTVIRTYLYRSLKIMYICLST